MTSQQRLFWFIIAYLVLLLVCIPAGIAGAVALLNGDDGCEWEDCTRLKDLPLDPVCLQSGDPGCLIVPD